MRIKDIMTPNLETVNPNTTLKEAALKMKKIDVGVLPVVVEEKVTGVVTDRDITIRSIAIGKEPEQTPVSDAMSTQPVFCYEDDETEKAAKLMKKNKIRRIVVLNHADKAIGIVSLGDLVVDAGEKTAAGDVLENVSRPTA